MEVLGGEERIFYLDLSLPAENSFRPQYGQVMVDPENPSWLVYNRDENGDGRPDIIESNSGEVNRYYLNMGIR